MRGPTLHELPAPPAGKLGWPWTEESPALPDIQISGKPWPKISIVTPSYNQGMYIEETIRSILLQGYPNLEYIIIDGGSTDESVAVIKKYEPWLSYWVSEKDRGQTHALNKGLGLVTGEIFNFINSDDFLSKGALQTIAEQIGAAHVLGGGFRDFHVGSELETTGQCRNLDLSKVTDDSKEFPAWHQPALWLRPDLIRQVGGFNEKYHYLFDTELALKYLARFPRVQYTSVVLANFRWHPQSKTHGTVFGPTDYFRAERIAMCEDLLADNSYAVVHPFCRRTLRMFKWQQQIAQVRAEPGLSRWQRRTEIVKLIVQDPKMRLNRYSLGHLRRC